MADSKTKKRLPAKIAPKKDTAIALSEMSPLAAMQAAINSGVDLDKVERMIQLQTHWDEMGAKKAYTLAMTEFKKQPPIILKDKCNEQYGSMYTTIGNLVNTVLPYMSACGLSHKWEIEQEAELITISCVVTHSAGYSERVTMSAPPDKSGSKNTIQQIKSTRTYLQGATFESVLGLASSNANIDDDGNGSELIEYISNKQKSNIIDMIASTGSDEKEFLKYLGVETIDKIKATSYKRAIAALKVKEEQNKTKEEKK